MRLPGGYANQGGGAPNDSWTFNPGAQEFVPRGPPPGGAGPPGPGGKGPSAVGGSPGSGAPGPMGPAAQQMPMPPGPMPAMGPGPMGAPMGAPMGGRPPMGAYPPMTGHYPPPWQQPVPGMHGHMSPWMPPGMPMGPHDWTRGPMPPYPGGHHMAGSTQGIGSQMPSNGAAPLTAPPAPPQPPHVFVALWNLHPEVSEEELKEELTEVDFLPDDEKFVKFQEISGAYLCGFRQEYFANAFAISFNGSVDLLRDNGSPIKAAKWTKDTEWGEGDIPSAIANEFSALRDELVK